ncbi:hypothetical protein N9E35_01660 [Candidatus Marinimicrobia bacterium]|nr:hypothetical protein [Candidatus Neomarinimicrobiota bacterium]
MNTLEDDINFLVNRMKEVHDNDDYSPEDRASAKLDKKIKLANLVLDDAMAEGCFEGFEPGTARQIEMARILNQRLNDYADEKRDVIPEGEQPEQELLDIVSSYLEDCDDEGRLQAEALWNTAEKALEEKADPIAAMDAVLGIETTQDEAVQEWQELLGEDGDAETSVVSDLTELEAEVVADVLEKLTPEPEPEPEVLEAMIQTPTTMVGKPEPEVLEPEPLVEPVTTERLDTISEIEVKWSSQADAEKLLQPLNRQPGLVDKDGLPIEVTPKRYSGPVPQINNEPQNMTSLFVKEKQVEREIETIVELYEETLADLTTYRQRLTALRDAIRRRL